MTPVPDRPNVLLLGPGGLGGAILDLLAREPWPGAIVAAGRDAGRGSKRVNLARLAALALGGSLDLRFERMDLAERESVQRALASARPDIVICTASLQSWWLTGLLPDGEAERIGRAGFGVWLPVHFVLTRKLMEALADSRFEGIVLTASFPDVVNVVLGRLGIAPTAGIGNVDEIVPKIQHLAALSLGVGAGAITVYLVGHHSLETTAFGNRRAPRAPAYLRIEHEGVDVTTLVRGDELLAAPFELPHGPSWNALTAASAVGLLRALLSTEPVLKHVPGPHGLPGGYPVLASRSGIEVAPIPGLGLEEAIRINEQSHAFDGIERIEDDGTVVFEARTVEAMREELGYDCARLQPCDMEGRAAELMARFRERARRHGIDVDHLSRAAC